MNFYTPISFEQQVKSDFDRHLERVDDYFVVFGGRQYTVVADKKLEEDNSRVNWTFGRGVLKIFQIFSYLTGIIPLIMYGLQCHARKSYNFELITPKKPDSAPKKPDSAPEIAGPPSNKENKLTEEAYLKNLSEVFKKEPKKTKDSIVQLAKFIVKTGFSNITQDNIIIKENGEIAIREVGKREGAVIGFKNLLKLVKNEADLVRAYFPIALENRCFLKTSKG